MAQIGELVKRQAEEAARLDEDSVGKLKNSLDQILQYAECEPDLAAEFRKRVETYKHLVNKNSTEDLSLIHILPFASIEEVIHVQTK